ncbi:MAG: RHS repeat-associated core domain-containing protein, partial [Clostridia bacterium]|nr:RHS repeat-associated core domain-containing protein [Clostridia bacterium]
ITGVYNQYGNPVTDPEDPAFINPLRYRSYYYDDESGLYYLNSRYYNPEWGSFISADGYVSTGEQIVAKNMYAYCLNNPANYADPSGMACICMTQRVHGDHVCYDIVNTKPSNSYDPYEYLHGTNIVNTMPKYEPSIGDNSWLKEAAGGITLNYSIAGADEFIEKFLVTVPQSPLMTGAKSMIGLSNVCDNIGIISMAALSWQMAWDITNYQGSPEKQIASVALNVVNAVVSASVGTVITASSSAVVWPVVLSVGLSMIIDSCFGVIKGNLLG